MDKDELLRLLDLAGTDRRGPAAADVPITTAAISEQPASPTALVLDDWGLRRGRELLAQSGRLQRTGLDELAVADFLAAAFEPEPTLHDRCADALRHAFVTELLQTPDYHALHADTRLDPVASELATAAFAEQFAALQRETAGRAADGMAGELAMLRGVGKAVAAATAEVAECAEARAALGLGSGAPGSNDPKAVAALYRRVRNSPTLRRVCELAGRFRRLAQSRQRQKVLHGVDDVVGVVLDGDVGRLLPHELAKLADDDELADEALRRLVERQLMCRQYQASEPVAKGPILVCTDESGSMAGDKGHTAKALALALAWIARSQPRWVALCAYSGNSGQRLLALPPGRWDETALLDWLEPFIGRGSEIDVRIRELPRMYQQLKAPLGQTDVIFLTDAQCRLPAELQAPFVAWKQSVRARLITLVIQSRPGDLGAISDELFTVPALSTDEAGVARVLSI